MTIYYWIILALWLIFITFWAVSAFGAKRSVKRRAWGREVGIRLVVVALILLVLRVPAVTHGLRHLQAHLVNADPRLGIAGVVLSALGLGLAIYARIHLGKNWGLPMSRRADPELVTDGPYSLVRHPIYSGLILMMLGSVLAETIAWILPLIFVSAYFIYSARTEERFMAGEFPEAYAAYRKRTKMLVPLLL
ncbi:MAG TPA: isoprenylcysteine carboxylmethyltransferase family protein [Candidatus Cybelea sp.]